jgi:CPA1 family monovalent cation:H+ antiporter
MDAWFEAQRLALGKAVMERRLTEEVARAMIEDIDLRQAARHTLPRARAVPPSHRPGRDS